MHSNVRTNQSITHSFEVAEMSNEVWQNVQQASKKNIKQQTNITQHASIPPSRLPAHICVDWIICGFFSLSYDSWHSRLLHTSTSAFCNTSGRLTAEDRNRDNGSFWKPDTVFFLVWNFATYQYQILRPNCPIHWYRPLHCHMFYFLRLTNLKCKSAARRCWIWSVGLF